MKNKIGLIFLLIALLSFFVRFWQLNKFPVSLNWDEVSHGYNAYSLIMTGKDQWLKSWPIFNFRAYGDYPTTLNMYLSIPFIYFFGLNEWTTRIVTALSGFGLVIVSYFLGKEIFKNQKYSLLLMFLVSFSPWAFFPSRAVFQSTVAQLFLTLGILFLLKSIKKIPYLVPGTFFTILSTYAYHNTKIVVPIILFIFFLIYFKDLKSKLLLNKKISIITLLIFVIFLIPQLINTFNKEAQARSRWVFIINPASINQIELNRNNFNGPEFIGKLLYNRYTLFTSTVLKNYLGFLNPKILFFNSTNNYQFNIPNTGVLYSVCLPFFYIGLFYILLKVLKRDKQLIFLISWFIVGLVPAVITVGDFPIIRAMTIIPLPQIFITFGIYKVLTIIKDKKFKSAFVVMFLLIFTFQSFSYLKKYFTEYSKNYSSSWQYGYKEVVSFIKENYNNYDEIIFTKKYGEPHEFILFFWPWDPLKYQNDPNLKWDFHEDWYWVNAFDKIKFINDWEIKDQTKSIDKKTLLITSPGNYNKDDSSLIKTIYFLDQKPAFDILSLYE
jgi:4-amino-4-deoxy-L-arabinose transferase-like glycosyltransferase